MQVALNKDDGKAVVPAKNVDVSQEVKRKHNVNFLPKQIEILLEMCLKHHG